MNNSTNERVYKIIFASVYPHYITKVEKKWRTASEVDQVICRLTGYNEKELHNQIHIRSTLQEFFAAAPLLNPNRSLITWSICGVKIAEIQDPLMKEIRYMDKLVDELAQWKAMEKILRS